MCVNTAHTTTHNLVRATGPWHRLILNDMQAFAHTRCTFKWWQAPGFSDEWIGKLQGTDSGRFDTPERRKEVIDRRASPGGRGD